jgi:phenylpropionate dioxygenase-like ring-hydroxylating dioxygenase large terminal subunit
MTQTEKTPFQWMPVALSTMIEPGTSAGAVVKGAEIVVWRDISGVAHVWEDRCPHRGMKMSFGFVRGDHIACLYHGWEYDESGTCQYIPAHPDLEVPKSICISRYDVSEAGGIIWAYVPLGSEAKKPLSGMPAMEGLRSLYVDASRSAVFDTLKEQGRVSHNSDNDITNLITLERNGTKVIIGLQDISDEHSALHIAVPDSSTKDAKEALLEWSEDLRRRVETREVAT